MSKTNKHQDQYDYLHENEGQIPSGRIRKILRYFNRSNFFDWDMKIRYRKYKDFRRGGESRIKPKNYK